MMVKYLSKGVHIKHKTTRVLRSAYTLFPVISLLVGCAAMTKDPWLKDVLTHPERAELTDKDTQLRISYLSRTMMESDDRGKLISEIQNTEYVKSWNAAQTATAAQITTDLVVSNLQSLFSEKYLTAVMIQHQKHGHLIRLME